MGLFLGIDYDSNTIHAAAIDEETGQLEQFLRVHLGPGDAFARARRVRDQLPARTAWLAHGVLAVGIEIPYTRRLPSLVGHLRVQGAIIACLPADLDLIELRPQTWKRTVLGPGHGNAEKPEVAAWARSNGAPAGLPQDLYDAFVIAHATRIEWETTSAARRRQKGAA